MVDAVRRRLRLRRHPRVQRRHRVAGQRRWPTPTRRSSSASWRTHALGPHHLRRLVLPSMRTRPRGDIVMISSVATSHYAANGAPYNMGKAALEALAFTLAKEERTHGIHVNVVAPGLVETEMGRRLGQGRRASQDIRTLDAVLAVRPGLPARSTSPRVVLWLCSRRAPATSPASASRSTAAA